MRAHFGSLKGQDDRGLGAGVQAAHRRHARGAGDPDHRGPARRGRERSRLRSGGGAGRRSSIFGDRIAFCDKSYDALAGADALAVVTEWNEFREPDFAKMRQLMRAPVVFDGRNIYSPEQMRALGFTYFSIGR